jgi:folate-dependent phosphoribosylglycinamide formyltransferase PurN
MGQVAFMLTVFPVLKFLSQKRRKEIFSKYDLHTHPHFNGNKKQVNSLSSDEARNLLKQLNPDLVLVNGTRIISGKTLESVSTPFINIHTGITPAFRGVHGGYWAIASGRKQYFGTTIHYVDAGVDTGGIIEQVFAEPAPADNFYTYPYLQYAVALPLLIKVVQSFEAGTPPHVKQPVVTDSKLWYHPTIFQWLWHMRRTL